MKQTKQPKFSVGDRVTHRKDLYGLTESTIVEIERVFKDVYEGTDVFEDGGLCTMESDIRSICIPYTFDGETLTVTYPGGRTRTAKFYGYNYLTRNEKMNTIWSEKSLKLRK